MAKGAGRTDVRGKIKRAVSVGLDSAAAKRLHDSALQAFQGHQHAQVSPNTVGTGRSFRDPQLNTTTRLLLPSKLYFHLDTLQIRSFITLTITSAHSPHTSLAQSSEEAADGGGIPGSQGISALVSSRSSLSPTPGTCCSMLSAAVPPCALICPHPHSMGHPFWPGHPGPL